MTGWCNVEPGTFLAELDNGTVGSDQIIDVREPFEYEYYHLEPSVLIPLAELPARLGELPEDKPLYIICAHGIRSVAACRYLAQQGFRDLHNVSGGMAAVAALRGFAYD